MGESIHIESNLNVFFIRHMPFYGNENPLTILTRPCLWLIIGGVCSTRVYSSICRSRHAYSEANVAEPVVVHRVW